MAVMRGLLSIQGSLPSINILTVGAQDSLLAEDFSLCTQYQQQGFAAGAIADDFPNCW